MALTRVLRKHFQDYLTDKIEQHSNGLLEKNIVDDITNKTIDEVETYADSMGINQMSQKAQDKKREGLYEYTSEVLHKEIGTTTLEKVGGDISKLSQEEGQQLLNRARYFTELKKEHDKSFALDSTIQQNVLYKDHSDIFQEFEIIDNLPEVDLNDSISKFIKFQLERDTGYKKLSSAGKQNTLQLLRTAISKDPFTEKFSQQFPSNAMEEQTEELGGKFIDTFDDLKRQSDVTVPIYRSYSTATDLDWDTKFGLASETGTHAGSLGQAWSLISQKHIEELNKHIDYVETRLPDFRNEKTLHPDGYPIDEYGEPILTELSDDIPNEPFRFREKEKIDRTIFDLERVTIDGRNHTPISKDEVNYYNNMYTFLRKPDATVKPFTIMKGYGIIRKPLVFPYSEPTSWEANKILLADDYETAAENNYPSGRDLKLFLRNIKRTLGKSYQITEQQRDRLLELKIQAHELVNFKNDRLTKQPKDDDMMSYPDEKPRLQIIPRMIYRFGVYQLNHDFQKWISSFGFDGVKYVNDVESSLDTDTDHLINLKDIKKKFKPEKDEKYIVDNKFVNKDRHWSYIFFKPQQFKNMYGGSYDPEDPRSFKQKGGKLKARGMYGAGRLVVKAAKNFLKKRNPEYEKHVQKLNEDNAKGLGLTLTEEETINYYDGNVDFMLNKNSQKAILNIKETIDQLANTMLDQGVDEPTIKKLIDLTKFKEIYSGGGRKLKAQYKQMYSQLSDYEKQTLDNAYSKSVEKRDEVGRVIYGAGRLVTKAAKEFLKDYEPFKTKGGEVISNVFKNNKIDTEQTTYKNLDETEIEFTPETQNEFKIQAVAYKKPQSEEMKNVVKAYEDKQLTSFQYDEKVKLYLPVERIKEVPPEPSEFEMAASLHENKRKTGILGKNLAIKDGAIIAARLDIPAYEDYGTWIVSLHDGLGKKGSSIGYGQTAVLNNVTFNSSPNVALKIAKGDMNKSTIARMFGEWENMNPKDVRKIAEELINSDDWIQVGMNPYRHSYFYDKETMKPIISAEKVYQIGPLVLAKRKNAVFKDRTHKDFMTKAGVPFRKGGKLTARGIKQYA